MELTNVSSTTPINRAALRFNGNYLKLSPREIGITIPNTLGQGQSCTTTVILDQNGQWDAQKVDVQMALKTDAGVVYFSDRVPIDVLFTDAGKLSRDQYLQLWKDGSLQEHTKVKALNQPDFQ